MAWLGLLHNVQKMIWYLYSIILLQFFFMYVCILANYVASLEELIISKIINYI
jgi:hypothetical protein